MLATTPAGSPGRMKNNEGNNEDGMRKEERVNLDVITVPRASSLLFCLVGDIGILRMGVGNLNDLSVSKREIFSEDG